MSSRSRVAVVGAGFIADFHLQILGRIPWLDVVALVDRDEARATELARRFRVPSVFSSVESLLAEDKPDVAHVLVPPAAHGAVVRELLEGGVGVFVEKPMATDLGEARELVQLAADKNLPLGVNHNHLFQPDYRKLKQSIAAGEFGRVEHVIACLHVPLRQMSVGDFSHWMFREPRNIVLEQGVHPFSQIHDLLGPVRSASTLRGGRRELAGGVPFFDTWQIALECERGRATVLLAFGKDCPEHWLHVIGQDRSMRIDCMRRHALSWFKTPWLEFIDQGLVAGSHAWDSTKAGMRNAANYVLSLLRLRDRTDVFYLGMQSSIHEFHNARRGRRRVPSSGGDGVEILEYCEAATAELPPVTVPASNSQAEVAAGQVAVTGGTGFLGGHLVDRLLDKGHAVRLLVRDPARVPERFQRQDVAVVQCSLTDADSVAAAVRGARAVYHLATGMADTFEEVQRTMVEGCRILGEACLNEKVGRLIFTSTIACYDLGGGGEPITEADPLDPDPTRRAVYSRGKVEAERVLAQMREQRDLPVIVFRPAVVVGKGGLVQHSGVGLWTRDTHCFGWGTGKTPLPLVLASDVADAMVTALDADVVGHSYNLSGEIRPSAREYVEQLSKRTGRRFRFHSQPLWWFQSVEVFKWLVKKVVGRQGVVFPGYRDLKSRSLRRQLSNQKAKDELGWQPVAEADEFWQLATGDFARNRWAPGSEASSFGVSGDPRPQMDSAPESNAAERSGTP